MENQTDRTQSQQPQQPKSWLTRLKEITNHQVIGGLVLAVLVGLFSVIGAKVLGGGEEPTPAPSTAASLPAANSTPPAAPTPSGDSSPSTQPSTQPSAEASPEVSAELEPDTFWQGRLSITADYKELDTAPPRLLSNDSADVWMEEGSLRGMNGSTTVTIGLFEGSGQPTHTECADAARGTGASEIKARIGRWFCISTDESRIMAFKPESGSRSELKGPAVIWEPDDD